MSNLRKDYTEGVGRTVLDLFKKVFQVKKVHAGDKIEQLQTNSQTGGGVTDIKVEKLDQGHVKLTKVEQYYDGTIYEGILNYNATHDISFNIKDRTKGHYNSQTTTQ
jgi:hypothetical protein